MLATPDSYVENLRPELYTDLQSPLSADLKALYRWKNGQINTNYEAFVNNSTFFPLEEALDSLKVLLSGFKHN